MGLLVGRDEGGGRGGGGRVWEGGRDRGGRIWEGGERRGLLGGGVKRGEGGRLWGVGRESRGRGGGEGLGGIIWMTSCFVSFFWFFGGRLGGVGKR